MVFPALVKSPIILRLAPVNVRLPPNILTLLGVISPRPISIFGVSVGLVTLVVTPCSPDAETDRTVPPADGAPSAALVILPLESTVIFALV